MLKSKTFKIIIGAIVVLSVLAASSIWVISSMKSNAVDEFEYTKLGDNNEAAATKTQIDHIIENSNTSDAQNDSNYNIYIITNGATDVAEVVKTFMTDSTTGFTKSIINDNRTISEIMPDGKINLVIKTVGELNTLDKDGLATALGSADLIYLYAPSKLAYTGNTAISEDLYEYLHNYAFGVNKPLIVNYELNNSGDKDDSSETTTEGDDSNAYFLASIDFKNSWRRTNTTNIEGWKSDTTDVETVVENYMSSNRSLYSAYQVNRLTKPEGYDTWADYWSRNDGTSTLNILYVYGDNLGDATAMDNVGSWMLGAGKNSVFNGLSTDLPENYHVDAVKGNDLTVESFYVGGDVTAAKKYDYIFIAPDNYSAANDISAEVRTLLNQLSADTKGLTYIMFGTLKGKTSTTTGGGNSGTVSENLSIDTSTNYGKLIDLSITTTGYAKKSSVLVIGTKFMDTLAANPSMNQTKISKIVSLINKSTFRNHAGSGGGSDSGSVSTTLFRVLELQPCYPIDLEYAFRSNAPTTGVSRLNGYGGKGNYYTVPANVVNTSEIDEYADDNGNVDTEYYQWDLSKAKLAYALNMSVDQIELVQMSTEEFITSKANVADSYDLIYVGGNKSALKPSTAYSYYTGSNSFNYQTVYQSGFTMYAHTGGLAGIAGELKNKTYTTTAYNGNDLTYDRLQALKTYIDAGMPIVFSNEIWNAYANEAKTKGYTNRFIDPDSNMYALCAYAESKSAAGNVLLGWENKEKSGSIDDYWVMNEYDASAGTGQVIRIDNTEGKYGSASKVTVFTDQLSDDIYTLVYGYDGYTPAVRPKYSITTNAVAYAYGDDKTKLTERDLTWTIELLNPIEGHTYQAVLLEDEDDNAEFDVSGETIGDVVTVADGKATLTYTYPSDDFGAFSWKVLVTDVTAEGASIGNGPSTGYSAISSIARSETQSKKQATILEIMPMKIADVGSQDGQDGHTLYLDSNFQQARGSKFLYQTYEGYNPNPAQGETQKAIEWGYVPNPKTSSGEKSYYSSVDIDFTKNGFNFQGKVYLGKYQTTLGINRYDSTADHEDFTYNYVDEIADDFDLSLDIMYMDDIEYYSEKANDASITEEQRDAYLQKANSAKEVYDAYADPTSEEYKALAEAETNLRNAIISIRDGNGYAATDNGRSYSFSSSEYNTYDFTRILESKEYFRFFYLNTKLAGDSEVLNQGDGNAPVTIFYRQAYKPYMQLLDKKIDAYRIYRHNSMLAYGPEEYLRKNYDVIVIGFYDDKRSGFEDFSTTACDDLEYFINADGSLLMTHDNMTKYGEGRVSLNLTNKLLSYAGMQRFGDLTETSGTESSNLPQYVSASGNPKYFVSSVSSGLKPPKSEWGSYQIAWNNGVGSYVIDETASPLDLSTKLGISSSVWNSTVTEWFKISNTPNGKIGYPGYSDAFINYRNDRAGSLPYAFAEFEIERQIAYNLNYVGLNITGTTKATQVNRGVVTTYPFFVSSDLRISPTHNQAYALDMEDDDVTVWYTFAADSRSGANTSGSGGSLNAVELKQNSSLYAASPKDGMDSYFIYSKDNITYCGAGHSQITGDNRDNNDERKLFLNVLVNMAQKSGKQIEKEADIILYDPDGTTKAPGNVVKRDAVNGYFINTNSHVGYPEFGFKMDKNKNQTVTDVQIFYDLDYSTTKTEEENNMPTGADKHIMVPTTDDIIEVLNGGEVFIVDRTTCPGLVTKRSYFEPYGGQYTYLVIRVTMKEGTKTIVTTKRIKVILTRDVLDLT